MNNYDLSILIPARNEEFLKETVEDILAHSSDRTEIIIVCDGQWPVVPIDQHERVTMVYNPVSIGQRAATNQACRLSEAKWVMKADAHCSFSDGFDVELMRSMEGHDDWTIVPKMYNLHAFNWICTNCGHERYQGPRLKKDGSNRQLGDEDQTSYCPECKGFEKREMIWFAKPSPETTSMMFDTDLRFQYFSQYKKRQKWVDGVADTMSILGACWMLTRERYWELDICDEGHGSWGQQGTEVACKSWLSGGRLVCNRNCWFAHMFRTQGGDFGFPYPQGGRQVEAARAYSRKLWRENTWDKAKYDLDWLVNKFAPVPTWGAGPQKGIVYYTSNNITLQVARPVRHMLKTTGLPIVSASIRPMAWFGKNIVLPGKPGPLQMFKQILAAIEASEAENLFLCEHDVLYHPTHFDFVPRKQDVFYYNVNVIKAWTDGFTVQVDDCRQTSGLCASRELLLEHYKERVRRVELEGYSTAMGYEPGTHGREARVDDYKSEIWRSEYPNIDIRLDTNLTRSRRTPEEFRNKKYTKGWKEGNIFEIQGWDDLDFLLTVGS